MLVLSQFTGAARELTDAVLVNPFDVDELADGLHAAPDDAGRRSRSGGCGGCGPRWPTTTSTAGPGMLLSEVGRLAGAVAPPAADPLADTLPLTGAAAWATST